ncbi:hypothetical protein EDF88_4627 [Buttiauxella sp. BIGb0552]|nr:hypothetical protein EDF88_4627 [Buttiauxella sp. BIGb0552]
MVKNKWMLRITVLLGTYIVLYILQRQELLSTQMAVAIGCAFLGPFFHFHSTKKIKSKPGNDSGLRK